MLRTSRFDGRQPEPPGPLQRPRSGTRLREAPAVAELFTESFRRGIVSFFPQSRFEPLPGQPEAQPPTEGRVFRLHTPGDDLEVELFGVRYRLVAPGSRPFGSLERRMTAAIGAVVALRFHHLFAVASPARLELYQGGHDDHHIAAFVDPSAYEPGGDRASRIASTIQTLRTAALSTYENRRISTGALLLGESGLPTERPTPSDALDYGVELTSLKSLHRLCDGKRTLFQVDVEGKLAGIVDIGRFASEVAGPSELVVPCARSYQAHALATCHGGNVCLVLSPNQEIKLFAEGAQAFAFAHGRWRMLDAAAKFATWCAGLHSKTLAWTLYQAALNLAETRHGALLVVLDDPTDAAGRLVAPEDLLGPNDATAPPPDLAVPDALAKRALHYLARGRTACAIDTSVLEALASLDGALVTDHGGRLLAFGAILRHDPAELDRLKPAEGARTTAALVASRHGSVLKVSEDGVVSFYRNGARVWDL